MEQQQPTVAPQVVYVKKESWILQLAALALWTIVTCWVAYTIGFGDGESSRGMIVESHSIPLKQR